MSAAISRAWNIKGNNKPATQSCFIWTDMSGITTSMHQAAQKRSRRMQCSIRNCEILRQKKQTTFCVRAETTSQLLWAQTDRQVEVSTSGVGVKQPISATATSCDCGGRLTTSFETFLGAHNTQAGAHSFPLGSQLLQRLFTCRTKRVCRDRTAETETRKAGQHFQVFYTLMVPCINIRT